MNTADDPVIEATSLRGKDRLRLIAERYTELIAKGSRTPAETLAKEFSLSSGNTRTLIHRARDAGYLPPTEQGVTLNALLGDHSCPTCGYGPPAGFTCNTCGSGADSEVTSA